MEIGSSFGARVDLKPCLALMSISKNDIELVGGCETDEIYTGMSPNPSA